VTPTRRGFTALALALGACGGRAAAEPEIGPLKDAAPFPLGLAAMTAQLADPIWDQLARTHFDRLTPEWEMKAEAFFTGDGLEPDFRRADELAAWADRRGLGLFGHTPVWYAQVPAGFEALAGDRAAFEAACRAYVGTVVGRYRGRVAGWDVVNEPVTDEGSELREGVWTQALGVDGHIRIALEAAHAADPDAPLFLNDYNLETNPRKLATFQRLVERLLAAGAPLHGLGTQTHVACDLPPGAITATVRELARFGLPIHISELDVSTRHGDRARQPAIFAEAAEAMAALPPAQRFGLTIWGARDSDSWLTRSGNRNPLRPERPLLFDAGGRAKPAAAALEAALRA